MTSTFGAPIETLCQKESTIPIVPKILIVEREYLVGLEAERILLEGMTCEALIATAHNYRPLLRQAAFDVLVIDADLLDEDSIAIVDGLQRSGVQIVVTTLTRNDNDRMGLLTGSAIVAKPFVDEELLAATQAVRELDL